MPTDNQIRTLLDPLEPAKFAPQYRWVWQQLTHGRFAAVSDQFGNTIDRTGQDDMLVKHDRMRPLLDTTGHKGAIHYYHATVLPLMVHPDVNHVSLLSRDDHSSGRGDKQD